jgi:signal recognition particle receptor subunit beta
LAILVGFGGFFVFFCRGGKKKFKGDAVFLVGPCDGGKTSLFFRLRDGLKNSNLRGTHTSMITNEATFAALDDQDSEQKPVRFIDFPGHRRLRPVLFANLEDCRAVIVVIDACTFSHQGVWPDLHALMQQSP